MGSEAIRFDPEEVRQGDIIRRRRKPHDEIKRRSYVDEFERVYGRSENRRAGAIESGRVFERILGTADSEAINSIALEKGIIEKRFSRKSAGEYYVIKHNGDRVDKHSLAKYIDLVRHNQTRNEDVGVRLQFPQDITRKIADELGIEPERVHYLSTIGTALDHTPGIRADAIIEIDGRIITVDVSKKEYKDPAETADVFIPEKDIYLYHEYVPSNSRSEDRREHLARLGREEQAQRVAQKIVEQYKTPLAA